MPSTVSQSSHACGPVTIVAIEPSSANRPIAMAAARRRGYSIAVVPIRWEDVRGSRMRPGAALALKVAWDLFRIPLLHRSVRKRR